MNSFLQKTLGVLAIWTDDGPWRSKSVLAALAVVLVGVMFWCSHIRENPPPGGVEQTAIQAQDALDNTHWHWSKPFPFYVPVGASYVAGFCIGWFFRKLVRMILVLGTLIITLLAFGKFAGCNMTPAQQRMEQSSEWAQQESTTAMNYLKHLLPSASSGGAGVFLGFRRRSKTVAGTGPTPG